MDFYGDNTRWFVGVVLNTNDPYSRGRVQVKIHGVHSDDPSDISNTEYPWAECAMPLTEGGVSGRGKIPGVIESAQVFGIFLDGASSQHPLVLGSMIRNEGPTPSQVNAAVESRNRGDFIPGNIGPSGIVYPESVKTYVTSQQVAEKRLGIMKFLLSQKRNDKPLFTIEQAAGIVGNLQAENDTFDPARRNDGGAPAYGLAQWYDSGPGSRLRLLRKFAARLGLSWTSEEAQLKYIVHELVGSNQYQDGGGSMRGVYNDLSKATIHYGYPNSGKYNTANSTWIILARYEIPGNHESKIRDREKFAVEAFNDYQSDLELAAPVSN